MKNGIKIVKRILKYTGLTLLGLILVLVVVGTLFMNLSPQFGGEITAEELESYDKLEYHEDGVFDNLIPTSMDMNFSKMMEVMGDFMEGVPNDNPKSQLPQESVDSALLVLSKTEDKMIWFGHSAVLMQLNGKTILLDPMLGDVPAPHPLLGNNRYSNNLPIEIEKLPEIDFVLISHDHYDHLDYESIMQLKAKTKHFLVPFGVDAHFKSWEIEEGKIHKFGWWDELKLEGLEFAFAPSRHFSGRGFARNETLWGSWLVKSDNKTFYFSGDGGYGPHFKEIGEKYGPIDFAMLECGQYNKNWDQIHMMPEETAQAGVDLGAQTIMPIDWGAFTLALHTWNDPVIRVSIEAKRLGIPIITPIIGEQVSLMDSLTLSSAPNQWWTDKALNQD
ncbi:MAG: MBL fold metallo-hydrolase [Schleiferiaceae bacterium]|nr:MBL fold metallo-hydrolase [Schleiferiaceae bacterium]